jgi:hypothetical protein
MTNDEAFQAWAKATYPSLWARAHGDDDDAEFWRARGELALLQSGWDARPFWEAEKARPEARRVWP